MCRQIMLAVSAIVVRSDIFRPQPRLHAAPLFIVIIPVNIVKVLARKAEIQPTERHPRYKLLMKQVIEHRILITEMMQMTVLPAERLLDRIVQIMKRHLRRHQDITAYAILRPAVLSQYLQLLLIEVHKFQMQLQYFSVLHLFYFHRPFLFCLFIVSAHPLFLFLHASTHLIFRCYYLPCQAVLHPNRILRLLVPVVYPLPIWHIRGQCCRRDTERVRNLITVVPLLSQRKCPLRNVRLDRPHRNQNLPDLRPGKLHRLRCIPK